MQNGHDIPHFSHLIGCSSVQTRLQTVQVRTLFSRALFFPLHLESVEENSIDCARISCLLVVCAPGRFIHLPSPCYSEIPLAWLLADVGCVLQGLRSLSFLSTHMNKLQTNYTYILFILAVCFYHYCLSHSFSLTGLPGFLLPVLLSCDLVFTFRYPGLIRDSSFQALVSWAWG